MNFELPNSDVGFLDNKFNDKWQTIISDTERGIIIKNYLLPEGYNHIEVKMMILIPQDYPMAALDMFYLLPEIAKISGNSIEALNNENHFNEQWQRWSRHYQWQAGVYNIATHFQVIKNSLIEELDR